MIQEIRWEGREGGGGGVTVLDQMEITFGASYINNYFERLEKSRDIHCKTVHTSLINLVILLTSKKREMFEIDILKNLC